MISEFEKAVLQIGCGAWTITAASLVGLFIYYAGSSVRVPDLRRSPTVAASAALAVFGFGSSMRGLLAWYRFSHEDFDGSAFITTWWPWFEISIFLNAIGAALAVYILAPSDNQYCRPCLALGIVVAAFAIPTAIWYF